MTPPIQASPEQAEVEVRIRTVDLNKEPLAGVTVEAYNATADPETLIEEGVTNQTGWVRFQLANDTDYSFKAFWRDAEVGSLPKQRITSNTTIDDFQCGLAHIKVVVTDEADVPLPYIDVVLAYSYLTRYNETASEKDSFETRENGTIVASNMPANANYTIEARRYGSLFNRTQIPSLNQLLEDGWADITITCPTYTLFTHVLDSGKLPLPNVEVEVYERSSRILMQSGTTNDRGSVAFNLTFGRYRVVVYGYSEELKRRVILNETVVDLIEDRSFLSIHCKVFNVTSSVKVVDYFGQPIPDAVIGLERKVDQEWVKIEPIRKTDAYGVASMPKIGGDYRISVYVAGDLCETRTVYLGETRVFLFKADKYTMVGGYPVETSRLIAYISLGLLIALLGLALSYRRLWRIVIRKKSPS
jgi:5-hydroxyisourate hydrolase-like protein (transthyretin family)